MKRKKRNLIIIITVMLALVVMSGAWLVYQGKNRIDEKKAFTIRRLELGIAEGAKTVAAAPEEAKEASVPYHVYSHRGSEGLYEHSFKAYDEAIAAGSIYIEQDLVISSDGVLFVSHDLDASFMTGNSAAYSAMTADEIDSLTTRAGYKVLRLTEVFDRYGKSINYVIELKSADPATIKAFEKTVDEYGFEDVITVQSGDPAVLETLEAAYPDMPKLFVCRTQHDFDGSLDMPYVDIISVKEAAALMTERNCEAAHRHGKLFSAWTLDSAADIRYAIDIGVDTYFTNDTPLALSIEREYGLEKRFNNGQIEE